MEGVYDYYVYHRNSYPFIYIPPEPIKSNLYEEENEESIEEPSKSENSTK